MKKLSLILIILGILVAISPLAGQLYTKYQEYRMMADWLDSEDAAAAEETVPANPEGDYSGLQEVFTAEGAATNRPVDGTAAGGQDQPKASPKPAKAVTPQTVLGIIQIKKIKVKAPIVEGVKAANLRAGIGHIPGTAGLGQPGNCALAGHRSYTFGKFFNRLDELATGDEIIITTKKEDLKYIVYDKHVVTPDNVSVLKGNKNDNIITLITCTPIYVASHRLIVNARLEGTSVKAP